MILCCGESLIDMLPRVTGDDEPAFAPHAGGAVFNTAIALGRLGTPVGFVSGLSNDMFGDILRDTLDASNVDHSLTITSDRPTTLAFVTLTNGQASYAFYDENTAGRMLSSDDMPALPDQVEAAFFGGISLMVEPCAKAYESLMARESAARVTMIDPNIRPSFIKDETVYRERLARLFAVSDIVKLSDEDLFWLEGEGDIETLAQGLLAKGPSVVFITEGAKGAHAFTTRDTVFVPAQKAEVVDTVGAGDTFNAGVLAALHAEGKLNKSALSAIDADTLQVALTLGVRVAGIVVARAGANPPWAQDLA
ncbi:MAG: carbohydrate kinase [Rhodovulum sp.]|nr:carbohydrate kinase [Rhodovulum sp.]